MIRAARPAPSRGRMKPLVVLLVVALSMSLVMILGALRAHMHSISHHQQQGKRWNPQHTALAADQAQAAEAAPQGAATTPAPPAPAPPPPHPPGYRVSPAEAHIPPNIITAPRMDPYVVQRRWLAGDLPDRRPERAGEDPCRLGANETRNAGMALIDQIELGASEVMTAPLKGEGMRILCITYTMESAHGNRIKDLNEAWGKKCTGWVASSSVDDPSIPSANIPKKGGESYNNMWQKLRSTWYYVYYHYLDEFDWFYAGGDDLFVIMENLRDYLGSPELQAALKSGRGVNLGHRYDTPFGATFLSGGPGYILDRAALEMFVLFIGRADCRADSGGASEDVFTAQCLKVAGLNPGGALDTRDALQRERFNPLSHEMHYEYRGGDWYETYHKHQLQRREMCCSPEAIAFHYMYARGVNLMSGVYDYLFHCPGAGIHKGSDS
mmetsp:Transcript_27451/g.87983  ORF Transcript_27451/g.87983 Transcript_27451/m.87983 type:complete len:439 (+) Transcript_27451:88-1404(+)